MVMIYCFAKELLISISVLKLNLLTEEDLSGVSISNIQREDRQKICYLYFLVFIVILSIIQYINNASLI